MSKSDLVAPSRWHSPAQCRSDDNQNVRLPCSEDVAASSCLRRLLSWWRLCISALQFMKIVIYSKLNKLQTKISLRRHQHN